jgi:F-type H+-transporting ATPase subunit alpha
MELLKQPQYSPYAVEDQVVSIWAGTKGKLDKLPVADVLRFEKQLLDHLRRNSTVLGRIASSGKLEPEVEAELSTAVDDYLSTFLESQDSELSTTSSVADGADVDVEQEQIVAKKRK